MVTLLRKQNIPRQAKKLITPIPKSVRKKRSNMGIGKSREMVDFDDLEGDFHDLDQSDDERITVIIDRSMKTVIQDTVIQFVE